MKTKALKKRQPKPLPSALVDELGRQQRTIYEAQALVQCIVMAMEEHFADWPRQVPLFNYALRPVVQLLAGVATALYEDELTAAAAAGPATDESGDPDLS